MTYFEELRDRVESSNNTNFHFDKLEWTTRLWIKYMCDFFQEKIVAKEPVIENGRETACGFCKDRIEENLNKFCAVCGRKFPAA